jgi:nucleoside-diphosphate-sugar epimerase
VEGLVSRPLPRVVLVTGATGFLGGHVCRALVARGVAVRGLVRQAGVSLPAGVEPRRAGGLDDAAALAQALAGVEGVVHLAAHVHQRSIPASGGVEAARFHAVNVEGTRTLLDAAIAAGVRDFVLASSIKAVGEGRDAPYTEDTAPAPADAYGVSKLEAERLVRARSDRLHAPVLRFPLVYGPEMKGNALRFFDAVARGTPLPLGSVRNHRSLLFTGNLVAAMLATLESEAGSDTFFVSDGEDLSTADLALRIGRALGRPARLVPVPTPALRAAGRAGDVLARLVPWPLTSAAVDRLVGSLSVDSTKLTRATGYRPPCGVDEALRITAEWYRGRPRGRS